MAGALRSKPGDLGMNCNRCRTVMGATHREEHPLSVLEWYDCPVCGRRELVATPTVPAVLATRHGHHGATATRHEAAGTGARRRW
jgi:hypothetical protein